VAFAEYDVVIERDAMSVYNFLLDARNLPSWIQYQVLIGPARPRGGYYLSTEGQSTRVRFALQDEPKGLLVRVKSAFGGRLKAEVGQLERLKTVLEDMPAAE
jgi:hypothetical protein